eukprot:1413711-Amphidinium_carterae.3
MSTVQRSKAAKVPSLHPFQTGTIHTCMASSASARMRSSTVSKKLRMEDSLSSNTMQRKTCGQAHAWGISSTCRSTTCGTGADCNVCLLHESGIDISCAAITTT